MYQKIIVSNANVFLQGYMYYLFTVKYNPKLYQEHGGTQSAFFTDNHLIGKYDFRNPNLYPVQTMQAKYKGQTVLYLVNPGELPQETINAEHLRLIQSYRYLDGTDSVSIYAGKI